MEQAYFEHALTVVNRVGRMVTRQELDNVTGFRSYFGFSSYAASSFIDQKRVKNTKGLTVYSEELFIDIDNDEQGAEHAWGVICANKISADLYISGNKGYHIHIPTVPVWSSDLPHSHLSFVKSLGIRCDECLYQAGRLFRLPNTIHTKSFRKKELVDRRAGFTVDVPIIPTPVKVRESCSMEGSIQDLVLTLNSFLSKLPVKGTRNNRLWALARSAYASGFSEAFTMELLIKTNDELPSPVEDAELGQILKSAKGEERLE